MFKSTRRWRGFWLAAAIDVDTCDLFTENISLLPPNHKYINKYKNELMRRERNEKTINYKHNKIQKYIYNREIL